MTGFFKKATAAEAAEQAAARMEAIIAAAEEAREEAAASGPPPKRAPGRPRKLVLGLLAALEKPAAPKPPLDRGANKPRGDWWRPDLIRPILREVATRGASPRPSLLWSTASPSCTARWLRPRRDTGWCCWLLVLEPSLAMCGERARAE
jgi:hypothetical protein